MRPLTLRIFKGMGGKFGAINMRLEPGYGVCKTCEARVYGNWCVNSTRDKPHDTQLTEKLGCIFLEMASPKGKNDYDWENKINFKLSLADIGKILHYLETGVGNSNEQKTCSLVHDPGAGTANKGKITKTLSVSTVDLRTKGAFFDLSEKSGDNRKQHKVPLTADEVKILAVLLRASISQVLGWGS